MALPVTTLHEMLWKRTTAWRFRLSVLSPKHWKDSGGSMGKELEMKPEIMLREPQWTIASFRTIVDLSFTKTYHLQMLYPTTMSTIKDFSSVPILDYSLLNSSLERASFITQLRHALINVGFLYLSNHPVSQADIDLLINYIPKLFALPQEAKEKIRMVHSEHFLGYSLLGAELTKGAVDQREQFDFATKHECRWKEGDPDHLRIWGASQVCDLLYV